MQIQNIFIWAITKIIFLNTVLIEIETNRNQTLFLGLQNCIKKYETMYIDHYSKYLRPDVIMVIAKNTKYDTLFHVDHDQTMTFLVGEKLVFEEFDFKKCKDKVVFLTDVSQIRIIRIFETFNNKAQRKNDENKNDRNDNETVDSNKHTTENINHDAEIKYIYNDKIFSSLYFTTKFNFIHEIEELIFDHFSGKYRIFKYFGISMSFIEDIINKHTRKLGISVQICKNSLILEVNFKNIDDHPIRTSFLFDEMSESYNFYVELKVKFLSLLSKKPYLPAIEEFIIETLNVLISRGLMTKMPDLDQYPEIINLLFNFPLFSQTHGYIPAMGGIDFTRINKFLLFEEYFDRSKIEFLAKNYRGFYFYFPHVVSY